MTRAKAAAGTATDVSPANSCERDASVKAPPRERLLDAAAELFARQGVNVSTDALCRAAGISKRSMYQFFSSKDEIIATSLARQVPAIIAFLIPDADEAASPREQMMYVFHRLEDIAPNPDFYGCPFLSTMVELKDSDHPASVIALRQKNELTAFFRREAARGGASDPTLLARQLSLVYDGAVARVGAGIEQLDGLSLVTAAALIDAAGIPAQTT
ncbi:TetR/AcrR family transcriptional regulator [Actinoallomurus iriomotensis]|uniref:TetR family transcriptional regulator n=1 Tax=Actinoallomurus iriomotensis TaxID=478107 RepID=A0A9W6S6X0_9ACTN|nr:TetR/AcrR family transcriptional regulator [Actinoallomurus iriomotensis]GLY88184.1 TetR family transcriptional regulator [Actinoallomurus iriomotensis]